MSLSTLQSLFSSSPSCQPSLKADKFYHTYKTLAEGVKGLEWVKANTLTQLWLIVSTLDSQIKSTPPRLWPKLIENFKLECAKAASMILQDRLIRGPSWKPAYRLVALLSDLDDLVSEDVFQKVRSGQMSL